MCRSPLGWRAEKMELKAASALEPRTEIQQRKPSLSRNGPSPQEFLVMSNWQPDNSPNPPVLALACLPFADAMPAPQWSSGQFDTFDSPPSVWPAFLTGQKASPVRVLLVDDDPHIRLVIAQELMADPRTLLVAQAGSVREGRRAIKQHDFDVLLVDLNLGDGDAFDLLGLLKSARPPSPAAGPLFFGKSKRGSCAHSNWELQATWPRTRGFATIRWRCCRWPTVAHPSRRTWPAGCCSVLTASTAPRPSGDNPTRQSACLSAKKKSCAWWPAATPAPKWARAC